MTAWQRWMRFACVGALGMAVQLGLIAVLTTEWRIDYRWATVAGVMAAVVHNFVWHRQWTWPDRDVGKGHVGQFATFALGNGVVSLAGNLAVMAGLVGIMQMPAVPANIIAIVACAVANYLIADRVVF